MTVIEREHGISGHEQLKRLLVAFWTRFNGKKTRGQGFSKEEKLAALVELANTRINYHNQKSAKQRRVEFDASKKTLHPITSFRYCFACGCVAFTRHHIVQIQHGGINSKKNLVTLCDPCHASVHPWLSN